MSDDRRKDTARPEQDRQHGGILDDSLGGERPTHKPLAKQRLVAPESVDLQGLEFVEETPSSDAPTPVADVEDSLDFSLDDAPPEREPQVTAVAQQPPTAGLAFADDEAVEEDLDILREVQRLIHEPLQDHGMPAVSRKVPFHLSGRQVSRLARLVRVREDELAETPIPVIAAILLVWDRGLLPRLAVAGLAVGLLLLLTVWSFSLVFVFVAFVWSGYMSGYLVRMMQAQVRAIVDEGLAISRLPDWDHIDNFVQMLRFLVALGLYLVPASVALGLPLPRDVGLTLVPALALLGIACWPAAFVGMAHDPSMVGLYPQSHWRWMRLLGVGEYLMLLIIGVGTLFGLPVLAIRLGLPSLVQWVAIILGILLFTTLFPAAAGLADRTVFLRLRQRGEGE